jgi:HlyD family secretion protein
MRRLIKWVLVLLVLALIFTAIYWQTTKPRPISVAVAVAAPGIVENTISNTRAGTIEACRRAGLSPSTGGLISVLNVRKGDSVRKGDLLLSLWNKDLMAEIELSQAEAESAKANARASCLTADVAQREANRLLKLKKSGAVSEETVDRSVTDASARRASCDAAKASTAVSAARANVIRARLDRTRLIAPFDGVVAAIHGELSEYVTPSSSSVGGTPVIDLLDTSCFHVTAPIDEVDAPRVSLGQTARVTLDAFGDREFAGTVSQIAPFVLDLASQARTVEIEVELNNPTDRTELLAGYSADVEIILAARNVPVRVPSEVVLENSRLFVLNGDTIEERDVLVGITNWRWAEIVEGVKTDESVVTSIDADGLETGALAEIMSEEE